MNDFIEPMQISVVGLGLIGGSLCRAIKAYTKHKCYGLDLDEKAITSAISKNAIDGAITAQELNKCDLTIVCLHPKQTIDFILNNISNFKPGSIVMDVCGVKEAVVNGVDKPLHDKGVFFVGTHPMAGNENSGFEASSSSIFDGRSFIITPSNITAKDKIEVIKNLALDLKFGEIVFSTPKKHDEIIAYTSQLAHVVSNAYVKSPTLQEEHGFSANSFVDLTRVAKLNENMWSSLFLMNKDPLIKEIDIIISNLKEYRDAIARDDYNTLHSLLRQGRILKEKHLEKK